MKRRSFLRSGLAALACGSAAADEAASTPNQESSNNQSSRQDEPDNATKNFPRPSPQEALAALEAGNRRYASGKLLEFQLDRKRLLEQSIAQFPFATIIGCSDSRVPVELIFDQDPGELFIIRLAGNVIDPDVVGSLEYAAVHLQTPLIVVMGHEGCGAVTAALKEKQKTTDELLGVRQLLAKILPALRDIDENLPLQQQVALGVEANVRWSMQRIINHPDHRKAIENGSVAVAGAVYELTTGRVRFLKS